MGRSVYTFIYIYISISDNFLLPVTSKRPFPCQQGSLFFGAQHVRQENRSSIKSLLACD